MKSVARLALAALAALAALGAAACGEAIALHAPAIAPSAARVAPARVELEPLATRPGALDDSVPRDMHPAPAEVLTSGVRAELAGRALEGGDPGGYRVRCTVDRFALRTTVGFASTSAIATLYVDLGCTVERAPDQTEVWRGALRARSTARATSALASEGGLLQRLADRTMSDAARELASDLAVRVLGLGGAPSARVFSDEDARARTAGIDDSPFGPAALTEAPDRVPQFFPSVRDLEPATRAAAWNAVAMAAGPGEPWRAGGITMDDNATVRFYQYKALARDASPASMAQLRAAMERENEEWLREMGNDAIATGGIGVARRVR